MSVDAYLNFDGNCREAAEFYAEVFGLDKPKLMTFGDVPPNPEYPLPEDAKNLIMHTRLNIGGSNVMFSDVFPGMPFTVGNNITLAFVEEDEAKLRSAFDRLKVGGNIAMELQETFWSKLYGQVTDKFGIHWQFNLGIGEY
ncbi:VOC family protein [Paenibacillus sp. JDR-2]|uniref:VOC family protein n=1 Tax=Paenibacillus sp. (strain JDR-2) TaxID=324057 RepID=UPI0001667A0F|nr:VOC family protein [Paenibacillus sp. JDR-2]ACT01166.1 Glyoxalase/bleomycin resistance protein/dioxygenase [Paenibacillus sp. JDR-2]